jgi:hypothetical protein
LSKTASECGGVCSRIGWHYEAMKRIPANAKGQQDGRKMEMANGVNRNRMMKKYWHQSFRIFLPWASCVQQIEMIHVKISEASLGYHLGF